MRMCLLVAISLGLLSPALAQSPETPGGAIGHPPPLPGPPSSTEPSPATTPTTAAPAPQTSQPAPKGYTGAYAPSAAPPPSAGPLPSVSTGPGLNVVDQDGVSTKTVKAVPCGVVARETDGFTTCVGIPDEQTKKKRR